MEELLTKLLVLHSGAVLLAARNEWAIAKVGYAPMEGAAMNDPTPYYWPALLPDTVLLTGRMGAGKDYVARQLIKQAGFTKLAFAGPVYQEVAELWGVTVVHINENKAQFRSELQRVGCGRRDTDPQYWVRQWLSARAAVSGPVVCTDCRFPNEVDCGFQIGALVLRIATDDATRQQRLTQRDGSFDPDTLNHPSESQVDTLRVHAEIPGTIPSEWYVPTISAVYFQLLEKNND